MGLPVRHDADSASLSLSEQERLHELSLVVDRGLGAFLEVAAALLEIRDLRLYRESDDTFEAFVRRRFGLARSTAYGLMDAARVAANVSPEGHELSLSHLRALAPLEADRQRELAPVISELTVAEARRVIRAWRAQQRSTRTAAPPPPLPEGTFRTIVADPPWRFEHDFGDGLAEDKYLSLSTEEIAAITVGELASPDSHLYLWSPVAKLPEALSVCAAWGFTYKGLLT